MIDESLDLINDKLIIFVCFICISPYKEHSKYIKYIFQFTIFSVTRRGAMTTVCCCCSVVILSDSLQPGPVPGSLISFLPPRVCRTTSTLIW